MDFRKLLSAVAVLSLLAGAACGGGGADDEGETSDLPAAEEVAAAGAPDLTDAGGIDGTVTFTGTAPAPQPVAMTADPVCQSQHSDAVMQTPVMVDGNGGLMNAVVHVASGLEGYTFDAPTDSVTLNQEGCIYQPHVTAVMTGQMLVVLNSDSTLHNVNIQPTAPGNDPFNQAQPVEGMTSERVFPTAEMGIPARCDVHPWMSAFINVFEHPYFAVTGENGSFSLAQLPPGDYVIEAWHETLGTQTQSVTVAPSETGTVTIGFEG